MSMVTYYNPGVMYRHQQAVAQNAQFHSGSPMHSWYTSAGYHQGAQMGTTPAPSYCMQDEQQMWQHHPHPHSVFQHEFQDYVMHTGMPIQQHQQQILEQEAQLPSPPITVSGSDMSSPGAGTGNVSPPQTQTRPAPVRSPYEWIKKTSYQTQPNPGKTRTKDKYRVVYTDHQRIELEKEFTFNNQYITIRRKGELANSLGLSERQIKIWFQNRRAKQRKQFKKRNEEKCQMENQAAAHLNQYQQQTILHQQNHPHHPHMQQMSNSILNAIIPSSTQPPPTILQRFDGKTSPPTN